MNQSPVTVRFGLYKENVPPRDPLPHFVQLARDTLSMISPSEKKARRVSGTAFLAIGVVVFGMCWYYQLNPWISYILLLAPVTFGFGYWAQSYTGVWGIGLEGKWDPDGTGIRTIEDETLRKKIITKARIFFLFLTAFGLIGTFYITKYL